MVRTACAVAAIPGLAIAVSVHRNYHRKAMRRRQLITSVELLSGTSATLSERCPRP